MARLDRYRIGIPRELSEIHTQLISSDCASVISLKCETIIETWLN